MISEFCVCDRRVKRGVGKQYSDTREPVRADWHKSNSPLLSICAVSKRFLGGAAVLKRFQSGAAITPCVATCSIFESTIC